MTMFASPRQLLLLLLLLLVLPSLVLAYIGPDGLCRIHLFAPFTVDNDKPALGLNDNPRLTLGFSNLVNAQLAVDDFNHRNVSQVPELAQLGDCNVQLELERVYDTGGNTHQATAQWIHDLQQTNNNNAVVVDVPCALAGPHHDVPALDLSVLAHSHQIPLVTSRTYALPIASQYWSPFTTTVHPDMLTSAMVLVQYLQHRQRSDFIVVVHPTSQTGLQRREALGYYLDQANIRWTSAAYAAADGDLLSTTTSTSSTSSTTTNNSYDQAMAKVKASGYRTVVVAMDDPYTSFQGLADAAAHHGLTTNGDYFFIFHDIFEMALIFEERRRNADIGDLDILENAQNLSSLWKMGLGAAYLAPLSRYYLNRGFVDDTGPVGKGWPGQGAEFAAKVNRLNPIRPGEPGYVFADDGYFQAPDTSFPEYSTDFVYDSVMSIGFGACRAARQPDGSITGADHHEGIDGSRFTGATGRVAFGAGGRLGARKPSTVSWTAVNFVPEVPGFITPDFLIAPQQLDGTGVWKSDFASEPEAFRYALNQTTPPTLLRDLPDQNYLTRSLRLLVFSVMTFVIVFGLVAWIWVAVCRKHRVFAASQPFFLYLICFGNILQSLAVLPLSFDESNGLTTPQLDRLCLSLPWLLVMGFMIVYGSLFTKLWRVNKVLQFSRRRVEIRQVAKPMAFLFVLVLSLLVAWTAVAPMRWERHILDEETGASGGVCVAEREELFMYPMLILIVVPCCLTLMMAYKTRDVDAAYSDSWWIFVMIMVQIEVLIISIPVVALLGEESPDAYYLGFGFIILSFPVSCLLFIMFPKLYLHAQAVRLCGGKGASPKRGERGNGRVTGINKQSLPLYDGSHGVQKQQLPTVTPPATVGSTTAGKTRADGNSGSINHHQSISKENGIAGTQSTSTIPTSGMQGESERRESSLNGVVSPPATTTEPQAMEQDCHKQSLGLNANDDQGQMDQENKVGGFSDFDGTVPLSPTTAVTGTIVSAGENVEMESAEREVFENE